MKLMMCYVRQEYPGWRATVLPVRFSTYSSANIRTEAASALGTSEVACLPVLDIYA